MNTFDTWLHESTRRDGVLACGLRYPDRTAAARFYVPDCDENAVASLSNLAAETFASLKQQKLKASTLRWTFDQTQAICVNRPDGTCLSLIAPRSPSPKQSKIISELLREFESLRA